MKRLLLLVSVFFLLQLNAQSNYYVDYSKANFDDTLTFWRFCSVDDTTADTDINYATVAFINPLAGYDTNPNDIVTYPFACNEPTRVDSLFAEVVHHNYSGLMDTIVLQITSTSLTFIPTQVVTYSDTIFTSQSLSSTPNEIVKLRRSTNAFTTSSPDFGVSITLKYFGPYQDTLKLVAGAVKGNGMIVEQSTYRSSYVKIHALPNLTLNSSIGYGSPVGSAGWFEAQNWKLSAYIRPQGTGIEDHYLSDIKIYPNPAQGRLTIALPQNATSATNIKLINAIGQQVQNTVFEKQAGEKSTLDVSACANGIYFLQVNTFAGNKTFKVAIEN